ncbi:MAG: choice-of-anchor M domain-containing protein, partial [Verrucomicrobiae bacterium]|nr:choice-of-anchor M domain-containing protein [Verrucomicrobiae bacterium]
HTDAISVFAENGGLVLGSKADVDGQTGLRLDPNLTLFNVEEATRTTVPNLPSVSFLGPVGSDVWLAPEVQAPGKIWPGFSTEGIPVGMLDRDQLILRLESVSGPGTLHVFQSGAFGEPIRLFSSTGTEHREWTIPRGTHAHANWAFSAPGAYTLTFSAVALTNGVSVTSTQSYAFVVGNVPVPIPTTTTLAASTNATVLGTPVGLTATVTPSDAVGWVEFLDGTAVLGHDAVNAGSTALTTTNLALGTRPVTARFVPEWLNDFTPSASEAETIIVTDGSGVPFGITGIAASYQPGETLNAQAAGVTLQPGQIFYWRVRNAGSTQVIVPQRNASPVYSQVVEALHDGIEINVQVYDETTSSVVSSSAWVPVVVMHQGARPVITQVGEAPNPLLPGDAIEFAFSGRALEAGETLEWGFPWYGGYYGVNVWDWDVSYADEAMTTIRLKSLNNPAGTRAYDEPLVVSVVRNSVRVARS